MKQKLVKIAKLLLLLLFVSYYFETTLFYHTHHFSWGEVTHSHLYNPFKGDPAQQTHTPEQCHTIDHLSSIILIVFSFVAVFFKAVLTDRIYLPVRHYVSHIHLLTPQLRAPPSYI